MAVGKAKQRTKGLAQRAGQQQADGQQAGVKKAVYESTKKRTVGVDDLCLLSKISNEAINENLRVRYENKEIYTYIGHVLISVNPFRDLGIYTDAVLGSYRGKNRLEMSPHVFATAEAAYYNMKSYHENQCIIISGESGAGKTEAAKRIMQYIANVSGGQDSSIQRVKDMVLATNPLLESFGCAKTLRNNNSSRHGKYLQIQFNSRGEPVGANIINYLLEKNRVVSQIKQERNFHIFYQFAKGASKDHRERFGIQGPEAYLYTSKAGALDVPGIDDLDDFKGTLKAMEVIGMTQAEQDEVFRVLATILWIGNVQFKENQEGNAAVADEGVTNFVAYLMEVDASLVCKAITTRTIETARGGRRGSSYEVPLNIAQASSQRDALAKGLYSNLFDWIIARVNAAMAVQGGGTVSTSIGILDIYGFEIFEKNSFEQLCINYVNEKLQQIFIQLTLKTEQEEYVREQIKWTPIDYFNNKIVCDLIEEKRPPGIFAALNDAIATAHADPTAADNTFTQGLARLSTNPHFEQRQGSFLVKHYAGDVMYAVPGLTDKNKDQLIKDVLDLIKSSQNRFLQNLFPEQVDQDNKRRPPTAGDKIKASANDLVNTLMQCQPHYIRTIKPNENKSPTEFNNANVAHQVKYLGLQENVRIRRAGFAYRQTFDKFVERFYLLSPKTGYAGDYIWQGDAKSGVMHILKDTGIPAEEFQMGTSKVFIKSPETLFALEHMRDQFWHNMARRIQRAWRAYMRYKNECAIKIQRMWRKDKVNLEFLRIRDSGHALLNGRKERRRMSLLGSRKFMGDYLGSGATSGPGAVVRRSAQVPADERVVFSGRVEVLISKLGRSSKPSPRTLIVTDKAVYLIIATMAQGQLQLAIERRVPTGQLKYMALSTLRDDWVGLGVGDPQAPDPFFSCVFKTELAVILKRLNRGMDIRVGPTIDYCKKPGKMTQVKFVRDEAIKRDDMYKSGAVHVSTGEPANSVSRPFPRKKTVAYTSTRKQAAPRATAGRQRAPVAPQQQRQPVAASAVPRAQNQMASSAAASAMRVVQPAQASAGNNLAPALASTHITPKAATAGPSRTGRAPPPPPPPPAAKPSKPVYVALYDFVGQTAGELSMTAGEVIEIVSKEDNGWWLGRKNGVEAWVPANYVEERKQTRAAPPAPPGPAAAAGPSANGAAGQGQGLTGLAAALKNRNQAVNGAEDEDDW
ncbi:P-loop containing nucleoside triphosphate hydrolase protein [Protomyces lactucae-debilis]|uniref:p-loop containing nucleoside triphosphate hydrolase protein n=1 Tax=Protomyces lactucae-debilis TaxID=2754530 RepID=A0A1Y2F8W7_PROLT|nr:P-loop containing nucleoside triphosphate hydrolase protein [Protomyces lactucae-debilis]ORY80358.1 P-loop containing nucleoside triphosphate hydrolase protein [Protomyces lactucae-debilis]